MNIASVKGLSGSYRKASHTAGFLVSFDHLELTKPESRAFPSFSLQCRILTWSSVLPLQLCESLQLSRSVRSTGVAGQGLDYTPPVSSLSRAISQDQQEIATRARKLGETRPCIREVAMDPLYCYKFTVPERTACTCSTAGIGVFWPPSQQPSLASR